MEVLFGKAVDNVLNKYSKSCLVIFVIIATLYCWGGGMPSKSEETAVILIKLISLIFAIPYFGIWTMMIHRAIMNKHNQKISIGEIIGTGFKFFIGALGVGLIIGLIAVIMVLIAIPIFKANVLAGAIAGVVAISLYIYLFCLFGILNCKFNITLKISSFFAFSEAFNKFKTNFSHLVVYGLKSAGVFTLGFIAGMILYLIATVATGGTGSEKDSIPGMFAFSLAFAVLMPLIMDMEAQLTKIIFPPKKRKPKAIESVPVEQRTVEIGNDENKEMPTIDFPSDNQENN